MLKPIKISISKKVIAGVLVLILLPFLLHSQEETVIDNKGNIIKVRNNVVTTAAVPPTSPLENDVWFDTSSNLTKVYDGTTWLNVATPKVSADTDNSLSEGSDSGVFYESPIKVFGKIASDGSIIKSTTGVTVTKLAGNGHYRVNLPSGSVGDQHYIIQLTQPGRAGAGNDDPGISYANQSTASFEVIIGDNDNGGTDRARFNSEFMFTVLDL